MPRKYEPYVIYRTTSSQYGRERVKLYYLVDAVGRWWILQLPVEKGMIEWVHTPNTHVEFHKKPITPVYKSKLVSQMKPHMWRFVDPIGQEHASWQTNLLAVTIRPNKGVE